MADTSTTAPLVEAAARGTTPEAFDYDAWKKKLGDTVSSAGTVSGGTYDSGFTGGTDTKTQLGQEAIKSYNSEYEAMQKQASQSAQGLELMGEATFASQQRLEGLQAQANEATASVLNSYNSAVDKAEEYAEKSDARLGESLAKIDEIFQSWEDSRDFEKAHAMQVAAQTALQGFKKEERNILETYGVMSPEYEQFRQGKAQTLAQMQSNVHATFGQMREQQYQTYMNVTNEAMWKQNMYTSFQEQQHVEMLKYMADAEITYAMQNTQLQVGIEQLKMAQMENLGNWIVGTPSFTMDSTPLVTLLAELAQDNIIGSEPGYVTSPSGHYALTQKPVYESSRQR